MWSISATLTPPIAASEQPLALEASFRIVTLSANSPERVRHADDHSACARLVQAEVATAGRRRVWVYEHGQPPLRGEEYLDVYVEYLCHQTP